MGVGQNAAGTRRRRSGSYGPRATCPVTKEEIVKLGICPRVFPRRYFDKMVEVAPDRGAIKRWLNIPVLYDLEARLRMMEEFGDYQQILTLSLPAIEFVAGPETSPELARMANDGMAEICARRPDKFPGFVASLPMNNVPAALAEI